VGSEVGVSMLDMWFMNCENDMPTVHVFKASKVVTMLVSRDVTTSPAWLLTSEDACESVYQHNAVHPPLSQPERGIRSGFLSMVSSPIK
jgi:hypothetical protein